MIRVDAVIELQLPIAAIGIGHAAGHELHPVRALLHREIEEEPHVAEEFLERRHIGRQAAENQAAIG